MVGSVGIRYDTVKYYKKSDNKWNKELKYIKKQSKILYSIAKKSVSRRVINKIQEKDSKKGRHFSSSFSSDHSESDSSIARDST